MQACLLVFLSWGKKKALSRGFKGGSLGMAIWVCIWKHNQTSPIPLLAGGMLADGEYCQVREALRASVANTWQYSSGAHNHQARGMGEATKHERQQKNMSEIDVSAALVLTVHS